MTAIQILQDAPQQGQQLRYRAVHRDHQAAGPTPGAALDALEDMLSDEAGLVVILQKFKPDRYFSTEEQTRLVELMQQMQAARDAGAELPDTDAAELERLIEKELTATARRTKEIHRQINEL